MPEVPPGGRAISLAGGLHIVCRYSMGGAPMPAGERPPTANAATQTPGQGAARGSPTKELDAQILRTEREIRSIPASINVQRFEARSFVSAEDASRSTASQGTPADMMHELRAALLQEVVRTKVVDLFARIDTDKNGTVSREEFRGALPLLGLRGYARSDMDMLFDHVDADRNGYIEYQELWRMLRTGTDLTIYTNLQGADLEENTMRGTVSGRNSAVSMRSGSIRSMTQDEPPKKQASVDQMRSALRTNRTRVIDVFRCLDRNGDGTVTKREFRAALPLLGFEANQKTADTVFAELDLDGSGKVEYEELNKQLRQGRAVDLAPQLRDGAAGQITPGAHNKISLRANRTEDEKADEEEIRRQQLRPASVAEVRRLLAKNFSRLIDLFRACDEDRDGKVTMREFRAALPLLGLGAGGRPSIDELFNEFDLDFSGTLDLGELKTVLRYEKRRWAQEEVEGAPF